jgi:hypothetical protein
MTHAHLHAARRVCVGALIAALFAPDPALAEPPPRVRVDSFVSASPSPEGLVMLQAQAHSPDAVSGEALLWGSGGGEGADGDVAVAMLRARSPDGLGEVRAGRMLFMTGAIRPLHLDGVWLTGHAPWGTTLEVFGGAPIAARLTPSAYDWAVGQRLSQRIGTSGVLGFSLLEVRDAGVSADRELGVDAALTPAHWLDGALVIASDLLDPGIADARASAAVHGRAGRFEAFATRRSPSRLLPATSLFAALGDVPSDSAGGAITWRAAPRLDVFGSFSVDSIAGELGAKQLVRGTLRLDDRGDGVWTLEARRQAAPETSWTGARTTLRVPLVDALFASTELELVRPDDPRDRGEYWPYGLVALGYHPRPWELSAALEGRASPTVQSAWGGLVRVAYTWGEP